MLYKTVVLDLIQQDRRFYRNLKRTRRLMATIDCLSQELRQSHLAWKAELQDLNPQAIPNLISSEAFEHALQEIQNRLRFVSSENEAETDQLEQAIRFIRNHS